MIRYLGLTPRHPTSLPGVCLIHFDTVTGRARDVTVTESSGEEILDQAAVGTFRAWRIKRAILDNWDAAHAFRESIANAVDEAVVTGTSGEREAGSEWGCPDLTDSGLRVKNPRSPHEDTDQ
jgi:Gram-negative bacterial TonB protein C-terminal